MASQLIEQYDNLTYTRRLSREIDAAYEAYKAREPFASCRLYDAFRSQARNILWHRLTTEDKALEHDITGRAMIALDQFQGKSKISTWFCRIAQNEGMRAIRSLIERRERLVSINVPVAGGGLGETVPMEIPTDPVEAQDSTQTLTTLRHCLPPEQAEVLDLNAQGHSLEVIAKMLGKPIGTIRGRYRLAKEKMRRASDMKASRDGLIDQERVCGEARRGPRP